MRVVTDVLRMVLFVGTWSVWFLLMFRLKGIILRDLRINLREQLMLKVYFFSSLLIFPFILAGEASVSLFVFLFATLGVVDVILRLVPHLPEGEADYHAALILHEIAARKEYQRYLMAKGIAAFGYVIVAAVVFWLLRGDKELALNITRVTLIWVFVMFALEALDSPWALKSAYLRSEARKRLLVAKLPLLVPLALLLSLILPSFGVGQSITTSIGEVELSLAPVPIVVLVAFFTGTVLVPLVHGAALGRRTQVGLLRKRTRYLEAVLNVIEVPDRYAYAPRLTDIQQEIAEAAKREELHPQWENINVLSPGEMAKGDLSVEEMAEAVLSPEGLADLKENEKWKKLSAWRKRIELLRHDLGPEDRWVLSREAISQVKQDYHNERKKASSWKRRVQLFYERPRLDMGITGSELFHKYGKGSDADPRVQQRQWLSRLQEDIEAVLGRLKEEKRPRDKDRVLLAWASALRSRKEDLRVEVEEAKAEKVGTILGVGATITPLGSLLLSRFGEVIWERLTKGLGI